MVSQFFIPYIVIMGAKIIKGLWTAIADKVPLFC